jgi:hypothetical protein
VILRVTITPGGMVPQFIVCGFACSWGLVVMGVGSGLRWRAKPIRAMRMSVIPVIVRNMDGLFKWSYLVSVPPPLWNKRLSR